MIKYIFNSKFIKGDEITFYVCVGILLLIIIAAFVLGYKEIKKHETK